MEEQVFSILLAGVDQGTAKVVTLGATAAARAAWTQIRRRLRRRKAALGAEEQAALATEPGQQVSAQALRNLLQLLPEEELRAILTVNETHVAGDVSYTHVAGDVNETHVAGDMITGHGQKKVYNIGPPWPQ
jgi:hypothetical protein